MHGDRVLAGPSYRKYTCVNIYKKKGKQMVGHFGSVDSKQSSQKDSNGMVDFLTTSTI